MAGTGIVPRVGGVPQALLSWVKRGGIDTGVREGVTISEVQHI
jgi:hypothetical protein